MSKLMKMIREIPNSEIITDEIVKTEVPESKTEEKTDNTEKIDVKTKKKVVFSDEKSGVDINEIIAKRPILTSEDEEKLANVMEKNNNDLLGVIGDVTEFDFDSSFPMMCEIINYGADATWETYSGTGDVMFEQKEKFRPIVKRIVAENAGSEVIGILNDPKLQLAGLMLGSAKTARNRNSECGPVLLVDPGSTEIEIPKKEKLPEPEISTGNRGIMNAFAP